MVKYRVFVFPSGTRPPFQADTVDPDLTQYSLSPDLCDGSTYRFSVAAVDRCEMEGPVRQSVSMDCCKCNSQEDGGPWDNQSHGRQSQSVRIWEGGLDMGGRGPWDDQSHGRAEPKGQSARIWEGGIDYGRAGPMGRGLQEQGPWAIIHIGYGRVGPMGQSVTWTAVRICEGGAHGAISHDCCEDIWVGGAHGAIMDCCEDMGDRVGPMGQSVTLDCCKDMGGWTGYGGAD